MANYCCATRTNYFRVKDPESFKSFMYTVYGSEEPVDVWEETDRSGNKVFGFGCYGGIAGVCGDEEEYEESCYDDFIEGLQRYVADDDAIIILESGNEKLRYLVGQAEIITSKEYRFVNIADIAKLRAAELLNNPNWSTKLSY